MTNKILRILLINSIFLCHQFVMASQEGIGINFFDLAHSDAGTPLYWDNNKSYVYLGAPATFVMDANHAVPVDMSVGSGSLVFTTTFTGGWWSAWFNLDWGHSVNFLRYGSNPMLHLRVKWGAIATGADVRITLRDNHDIWNLYNQYAGQGNSYTFKEAALKLSTYVTPSTAQWQDVYIPMSDFLANNPNVDLTRISVLILQNGNNHYSATNKLYIEKIKIVPDVDNLYTDVIKVNLLGYLTNQRKLAFVSYETGTINPAPTYFQVKDVSNGNVVYQANLVLDTPYGSHWDYSNDTVFDAVFTSFTTPGRYVIHCPQINQTSPPFDIGNKVFDKPLRDVLRYFYYARCSQQIAEPFSEGHIRPAIYANNTICVYDYDDEDPTKMYDYDYDNRRGNRRDVSGGLFDAGDLHLDIHNNVVPMWFLLETFKDFKNKLGPDVLNIPVDSQINDLVFLIKYQLDWFKKMQNSDGSVHFIVISENGDLSCQQVSDVSTGSACVLAGIFAKASALFSNVPGMESYSADLLNRAQLSWSWLMAHPDTYDPTGTNGSTWSYEIVDDTSYRSFAAIELYLATANNIYNDYFVNAFNTDGHGGDGIGGDAVTAYGSVRGNRGSNRYGYINLMCGMQGIVSGYMDYVDTALPVNETIANNIKDNFLNEAYQMLLHNEYSTYKIPLLMYNDISWGTSGYLCGNAYVLLRAYKWTGNSAYRDAALDVLDHIGGRNPVARIFITGNSYSDYAHGTDVYSFYWFNLENPVPGYLCGNINAFGSDWGMHPLSNHIKGKYKYYLNLMNPSLLEPGLPSQAMLAYLLGYFAYDLKLPEKVDLEYIAEFCSAWLSEPNDNNWNPNFDLSNPQDHVINFSDFTILAGKWMEQ